MQKRPSFLPTIVALGAHISPIAGASLITALGGSIWWILAIRLSAPEQVGRFVVISGITTLITEIAGLGIGYMIIRYLAEAGNFGSALIRTGLILITGATLLCTGGFAVGVHLFAAKSDLFSERWITVLIALTALGNGWYTISDNLLLATNNRHFLLFRAIFVLIFRIGTLALLTKYGYLNSKTLLFSYAAPLIVAALITFAITHRRILNGMKQQVFLQKQQLKNYLLYGIQSYLGNMIATITPNFLPTIVATHLGTTASAQFGVIWMIANLLLLVPTAISMTSFSVAARREGFAGDIQKSSMWLLLIVQIGSISAALLVAILLLPRLGSVYSEINIQLLAPFLIGVACISFTSQTYSYARIVNKGLTVIFAGHTIQMIITLSLTWILLPSQGLLGVSLAWFTGTSITLTLVRCFGQPYLNKLHALADLTTTPITHN